MITGEPSEDSDPASHRVIIVGVDDSAEAEAAAQWAVREAELRRDDVLLVHAYDVSSLAPGARAESFARGRQDRKALLDKVAGTLTVPPSMHLDQLIDGRPRVLAAATVCKGGTHGARSRSSGPLRADVTRARRQHGGQHVEPSRGGCASWLDATQRRPTPDRCGY